MNEAKMKYIKPAIGAPEDFYGAWIYLIRIAAPRVFRVLRRIR